MAVPSYGMLRLCSHGISKYSSEFKAMEDILHANIIAHTHASVNEYPDYKDAPTPGSSESLLRQRWSPSEPRSTRSPTTAQATSRCDIYRH